MEIKINSEEIKRFGAVKDIFDKIPEEEISRLDLISTGNFDYFCILELRDYFKKRNSMIKSFTLSSEIKLCPQFSGYSFAREYILPEGIQEIPDLCFFQQTIEKLVIPESVQFINDNSFYKAEIKSIECKNNSSFECSNGKLLNSFTGICLYDVNRKIYDFTNGEDKVLIPFQVKSFFDRDFWKQKKEEFLSKNKLSEKIELDYDDIKEKLLKLPFKDDKVSFLLYNTEGYLSQNEPYNEAYLYFTKERFLTRTVFFELNVQTENEDTKNIKSLLYKIKCCSAENSNEFDLIIGFIIRDGNIDVYIPHLAHFVTFSENETGFVIPYVFYFVTNLNKLLDEMKEFSKGTEKEKEDKYKIFRQKRLAAFTSARTPEEVLKEKINQLDAQLKQYNLVLKHIEDDSIVIYKENNTNQNNNSACSLVFKKEQILFTDPATLIEKIGKKNVLDYMS